MNIIQEKLVNAYTVLVMADRIRIKDVPSIKSIGKNSYEIRSEVELEIANRTIETIG